MIKIFLGIVLGATILFAACSNTEHKFNNFTISSYQELKNHKTFIIYVTAPLCLTCQVQEDLWFEPDVKQLLKDKNIKLYKIDRSKATDKEIEILKKYNAIMLPAYIVVKTDGTYKSIESGITAGSTKHNILEALSNI